jgi:glutamate dehydrogenase (NADP+)
MLEHRGDSVEGKKVVISGSGNVALYAAEKARELGGTVIAMSDSGGSVHHPEGIGADELAFLKDLKERRRGRISEYAEHFGCEYLDGQRPWCIPCDIAVPCATQNELDDDDAKTLLDNGCAVVAEGANMPSTTGAAQRLHQAAILYAPSKAANAGGVAVSGLEQSQNSQRIYWTHEEVDAKLREIMKRIHDQCVTHGCVDDRVDYVKGANVAGFVKVANAMLAYGVV